MCFFFSFSALFWCQRRNLHRRRKREYLVQKTNGLYHLLKALNTSLHPDYKCLLNFVSVFMSRGVRFVHRQFTYFTCVGVFYLFYDRGVTSGNKRESVTQGFSMLHSFPHLNICYSRRRAVITAVSGQQCFTLFPSLLLKCQSWHLAHTPQNSSLCGKSSGFFLGMKCGLSAWLRSPNWTCFMW